ncbi:probable BTB/POZ domain-containing protein At3g56230 [Coccomyxa sp. Obi]|nr:probable BTB/POZ domain-containing protein At3g56230 [Coccomyxa sp. Obi]
MSSITESEKTEGKKKDEPLKYLESTPAAFREIADAILILDSGEKLPAHRQVLSLKSEVFCGICESAPAETGPESKLHIPLPECSLEEARIFLDFIYNNTPVSDPLAAESLTKVAHKFNVKSALLYCDNFLAQKADEDESFLQLQTRRDPASRSVLDWAVMANMYSLRKLTAHCELFIMKHFHASPSSRRILATLSPDSQLRIYKGCSEAKATCSARCQACGRVLMQGEAFHISKALTSCGHEGCTGCVKVKAALTEFPSLELIESWQDV